jgi:maleate isomerase
MDGDSVDDVLAACCRALLGRTGADRVTVRVDLPHAGWAVDRVAAEACRPGTRSIAQDCSLDQRRLQTVMWLEEHRQPLVQPDFSVPPFPPPELVDTYGVRAQILVPLDIGADDDSVGESDGGGPLVGWLSVHSGRARPWTELDVAAACSTAAVVGELFHQRLPAPQRPGHLGRGQVGPEEAG